MIERDVETIIDKRLKTLGWEDDPHLPNRNVYKQSVKTKEQANALKGTRPDYVLYKENSNEPLIVIETKKPDESISKALEQAAKYAKAINAPIIIATTGVFTKTLHISKQKPLFLNKEEVTKLINHSAAVEYIDTNELFTMDERIIKSREELLNIFKDINNQFREAGVSTGLPRIELFCNLLFLKVITELSESNSLIKKLPEWCKWNAIREKKGDDLHAFINRQAFTHFQQSYGGDVLSPIEYLVNPNILDIIVSKLDDLHLSATDTDIKGDAFEYFLRNYGGADTDFGEYFTPRHIVKALVQILNPIFGEKVYDPFCGTGGMLIEAYKHIYEGEWAKNSSNIKRLKKHTIYGADITQMYRIAKMNMILAGDGHNNIIRQDSYATPDTVNQTSVLKDGIEEIHDETIKYDVVITNMPFGYNMKTEHAGLYGFNTKSAEITGVLHCLRALSDNENARCGIIVPEGVLFRTNKAYTDLRELIITDYQLETVISLPQMTFAPNTGVKSDIIIIKKQKQKNQKHIWYFDVKNDGYTLDTGRRRIEGVNDIDNLLAETNIKKENENKCINSTFEKLPLDKVCKNSFILVGSRYNENEVVYSSKFSTYKLSDITECLDNKRKPLNKQEREKIKSEQIYPYCGATGVLDYIDRFIFNQEILCLAEDGGVWGSNENSSYIMNRKCWVNNHAHVLIAKENADLKYLMFIINAMNLNKYISGTTRGKLTKRDMNNIDVPLPPLDVQRQIVKELEGYQQIVNGAKAIVEGYKPNIKVDSEWKIKSLRETDIEIIDGDRGSDYPSKNDFFELGYCLFLNTSNVRKGFFNFEKVQFVTKLKDVQLRKGKLSRNDIVLTTRGTVGNIAYYSNDVEYDNIRINSGMVILRPDTKQIDSEYLMFLFLSDFIEKQIENIVSGTAQPQLPIKSLNTLKIPLPSLDIQKEIVSQIKSERALIEPSKQIIEVFTKKIQDRIGEIFKQ